MEQEDGKNGAEIPPQESSNPQTSEKDDSNKDTNAPDGSSKPSDKKTPKSLKVKTKIVKKSKTGKLKAVKKVSLQIGEKTKNNKVMGNIDELSKLKNEKAENNKGKEIQNGGTSGKSRIGKSENADNNKLKKVQTGSASGKSPIAKSKKVQLDKTEQRPKNEENHRELDKGEMSRINKTKHSDNEKPESSEKNRENIGGYIFMCNTKTKPDCFRYRIMAVPVGQKEVVLGIKPGTTLYLYDFDLKLLYGVYKASSSGGMKLEPYAFGGNFPAQVRFSVASDCFPLPERIFKNAIKENYNKNKFKTELTVTQVRRLTTLFRPVDTQSAKQLVPSPPKAIIRDREARDDVRGSQSHLHMEIPNVLSRERDHQTERQEDAPPRDLFLTEKSYRTYGLLGVPQANPIANPYERDSERVRPQHNLDHTIYRKGVRGYEGEHHQQLEPPIYRKEASSHAPNPLQFNVEEHQTYYRGAVSELAARDPYLPPLSREEITSRSYLGGGRTLIGIDNLQRGETVADSRLYSTHSAANALSEYNQMQRYHGEELKTTTMPVSSRYSFSGPSYSLR